MKAPVSRGPGRRPGPMSLTRGFRTPTDIIVRIDTTTICGTDLHMLKGDMTPVMPGRILGREGVGVITEGGVRSPNSLSETT